MDTIAVCTFEKICSAAPLGKYVIISEDEFFDVFPEGTPRRSDELNKALKNLKSGGYIDVRYSGGNMFCVAPLKKSELNTKTENETAQIPVAESGNKSVRGSAAVNFIAAFAGGALGSLIICLVFALI